MTLAEALADIEMRGHGDRCNQAPPQEEAAWPDTQAAVRLLAAAFEHLRKRDPLFGHQRRFRSLGLPPGSVPPA